MSESPVPKPVLDKIVALVCALLSVLALLLGVPSLDIPPEMVASVVTGLAAVAAGLRAWHEGRKAAAK